MKVLLDMNLSPIWVEFLTGEGFEAVHWATVGAPDAPDGVIMAWAAEQGFVLFTHDLDFGVLLALTSITAPSVVQVRVQAPIPEVIGREVVRVLRLREAALLEGALVTIDESKSRVRILPFAGRNEPKD